MKQEAAAPSKAIPRQGRAKSAVAVAAASSASRRQACWRAFDTPKRLHLHSVQANDVPGPAQVRQLLSVGRKAHQLDAGSQLWAVGSAGVYQRQIANQVCSKQCHKGFGITPG